MHTFSYSKDIFIGKEEYINKFLTMKFIKIEMIQSSLNS